MTAASFDAHRALAVTAAASLLVGLVHSFTPANSSVAVFAIDATGYAAVLALAVAAVCVDRPRLKYVDVATLGTGIVLTVTRFAAADLRSLGGTDERVLGQLAMRTLLGGGNPYAHRYTQVGANGYGTPLLSGGQADTYAYPPLQLEIGRAFGVVSGRLALTGVVDMVALVALAVAMFVMLPVTLRPLAVVTVLGLDLLTPLALAGLPAVLAVALLCVPLYRWTATGLDGRLGRLGVAQAIGLGLAASAQQLSWFLVPFLVTAIFLLRRGVLGPRHALGVVARYIGIAALTFGLVSLPFVIAGPAAWARAMSATLTQNAIVEGVGWALPMLELDGGSGRLGLLTWAAVLLLAALLVIFALGFQRLAPAVAVLPWLAFLVSTRTNPQYFYVFLPVWLLGAAQTDSALVAASAPLRLPRWIRELPHRTVVRLAAVTVLLAPAVVAFVGGVTGRPPVTAQPVRAVVSGTHLDEVDVLVTNHTAHPLAPQYFIDVTESITSPWVPMRGPTTIAPHQQVLVALRARTRSVRAQFSANLWVFTTVADPAGLAASRLRLPESRISRASRP